MDSCNYYKLIMTTIQNIETLLNIEVSTTYNLRDGKKTKNKNRYYYLRDICYVVELTKGMWMICEDCKKTRVMLQNNCWCCTYDGYTYGDRSKFHRLFMNCDDNEVFIDHINRKRYDNRHDNLRIATPSENSRNTSKCKNNTSDVTGVYNNKQTQAWVARINSDNNTRISRSFSEGKYPDAKQRAIDQRKAWEIEFGYTCE